MIRNEKYWIEEVKEERFYSAKFNMSFKQKACFKIVEKKGSGEFRTSEREYKTREEAEVALEKLV